jgi:hypothetical protein
VNTSVFFGAANISKFLQSAVGRPIIAARKIHFTVDGKQSEAKVSQVSKITGEFFSFSA